MKLSIYLNRRVFVMSKMNYLRKLQKQFAAISREEDFWTKEKLLFGGKKYNVPYSTAVLQNVSLIFPSSKAV